MNKINTYKSVVLAYFSGTNCTKKVVEVFKNSFDDKGISCIIVNTAEQAPRTLVESDLLIVFSPVYAFRLTSFFEKWIKGLPQSQNKATAVISVSGGGEVSPNTACRVKTKRILKSKGYSVIYEEMFTMPSNFAVPTPEREILEIIKILPEKSNKIVTDILAGKKNILTPKAQDRFIATIGKAEHFGGKMFGSLLRASSSCNNCGLCISNCPTKNIRLINGKLKFGFKCVFCLKCIYNCPQKAISPIIMKSIVIKDGFDISKY